MTDKLVLAGRFEINILVTNIVLELAEQLGVPKLETKDALTVDEHTPSLIDKSEGRTIFIEAPEMRLFLKSTVNVYDVILDTVLVTRETLAEANLLAVTTRETVLLANEKPFLDIWKKAVLAPLFTIDLTLIPDVIRIWLPAVMV